MQTKIYSFNQSVCVHTGSQLNLGLLKALTKNCVLIVSRWDIRNILKHLAQNAKVMGRE